MLRMTRCLDPNLRLSAKPLPIGAAAVHILQSDFYDDEEKQRYKDLPNSRASVANVGIPIRVRMKRVFGKYPTVWIVGERP